MKIAVCSLSQFAHVSEFVDVAARLSEAHTVRYFLGFACQSARSLLEQKRIPYQLLLDEGLDIASVLTLQAAAGSTHVLFKEYFFKHAELILPDLIKGLRAWKPDLVLAYLRDYAGMTAAEILDIPFASFGSLPSPVRVEGVDPPFGAGIGKDASRHHLQLMWQLQHRFHERVDGLYNETIRRPYELHDVHQVSTLHSKELVILGTLSALSSKRSPEPPYVKYVGPLFSGTGGVPDADENETIVRIAASPRPRIFISLGTTYVQPLLERCLAALSAFPGTIIVTGSSALLEREGVIGRPFFTDFARVLGLVDAVVTVTAAKTVLNTLAAGKPLVCLPQQGEQIERAYALASLGAAEVPCPRRWDAGWFASVTAEIATNPKYRQAAAALQTQIESSGGVDAALKWLQATFF